MSQSPPSKRPRVGCSSTLETGMLSAINPVTRIAEKCEELQLWEREKHEQLISLFPEVCPEHLQTAVSSIRGTGVREERGAATEVDNASFQVKEALRLG